MRPSREESGLSVVLSSDALIATGSEWVRAIPPFPSVPTQACHGVTFSLNNLRPHCFCLVEEFPSVITEHSGFGSLSFALLTAKYSWDTDLNVYRETYKICLKLREKC